MTTIESVARPAPVAVPAAAKLVPRRRPRLRDTWWRHVIAVVAIVFSLFPVVYVLSSAFNSFPALGSADVIPDRLTLDNFRLLFDPTGELAKNDQSASQNTHYLRWYANSMIVAGSASVFNVILGAFAAYAFSRFRFRGRRMGMMTLLLIQMFPNFLALVAIYLILLRTGGVFPALGLNTLTGLIVVYLAGAMGMNTWLMKGFFDTIPAELDESARVDGATPGQIFWGVVMPLAAPVLAVVALLTFIGTLNEFLLASALLQDSENFTLPVGMKGYIDQQYAEHWGPFAAGAMLAAIPVAVLFMFLQRFIIGGLTQGSVKG